MPHLTLEFSANVTPQHNLESLFLICHDLLANILPTDIASCKSRAIKQDIYSVGNGETNNAFIHLTIKVMAGRSEETLQRLGNSVMQVLQNHFMQALQTLNTQITLEIVELSKQYFKQKQLIKLV